MEGAQQIHAAMRGQKPEKLRRVPDRELQKPRRALISSCERFLTRCVAEHLIKKSQYADAMHLLGVTLPAEDP